MIETGYYDGYEQEDPNQASFTQNEYYTRRLTDLTNVLYVSILVTLPRANSYMTLQNLGPRSLHNWRRSWQQIDTRFFYLKWFSRISWMIFQNLEISCYAKFF